MSIPSTLASSACPTLPSPRRVSAVAPVRLLGAHVVWRMLWDARRPAVRPAVRPARQPADRTAPQVDLRGRLEVL
ncbi:hypothetical protein EUA93_01850 [Nocardioides oleivorans]|uniref:Uncharacterized protein n=1 Tax=Nocardioides oleivorans TaxID=273676 RepID=A0A4Q2RYW9_9ACTN|nr:hypothetical protein [Nocardioides oleivorans]RYB93204.1 hypothetical protein EUA93_01850 [Nocardioides oleivorans]